MPQKLLSRSLSALRRLYRFPGQLQAPASGELELPLQFVHDVSREAELSRVLIAANTAISVDTVNANTNAFDTLNIDSFLTGTIGPLVLPGTGLELSDIDLWLLRADLRVDADFSQAEMAALVNTVPQGFLVHQSVAFWDVHTEAVSFENGVDGFCYLDENHLQGPTLPMRLTGPGAILKLGLRSGAGGGCAGTVDLRFAVCCKDTLPDKGL